MNRRKRGTGSCRSSETKSKVVENDHGREPCERALGTHRFNSHYANGVTSNRIHNHINVGGIKKKKHDRDGRLVVLLNLRTAWRDYFFFCFCSALIAVTRSSKL